MRTLTALAALLVVAPVFAVDSSSFKVGNASQLVELCSSAADDPAHANAMGFCHGYLSGAYQYYDSTQPTSGRFVCAPNPTPTRAEVMNRFVAWARAHPRYMNDAPADTLFRFLAETYPCNK